MTTLVQIVVFVKNLTWFSGKSTNGQKMHTIFIWIGGAL